MPEGILILILLAFSLLAFLVVWLLRRHLGSLGELDPVARYKLTRGLLVFWGILLVVAVVDAWREPHRTISQRTCLPAILSLCLISA